MNDTALAQELVAFKLNGADVQYIARVELGSQDYTVNAYLNNDTATALVPTSVPAPTR